MGSDHNPCGLSLNDEDWPAAVTALPAQFRPCRVGARVSGPFTISDAVTCPRPPSARPRASRRPTETSRARHKSCQPSAQHGSLLGPKPSHRQTAEVVDPAATLSKAPPLGPRSAGLSSPARDRGDRSLPSGPKRRSHGSLAMDGVQRAANRSRTSSRSRPRYTRWPGCTTPRAVR